MVGFFFFFGWNKRKYGEKARKKRKVIWARF